MTKTSFLGLVRGREVEDGRVVLSGHDSSCGETASITGSINGVDNWIGDISWSQEIAVQ